MQFFDNLEIRSLDERQSSISQLLPKQIKKAQTLGSLEGIDPSQIKGVDDLTQLPVFRKSELIEKQKI
jgi:phenylacetate-coenzyme A ligase PaaK-like adenylate-forming protein